MSFIQRVRSSINASKRKRDGSEHDDDLESQHANKRVKVGVRANVASTLMAGVGSGAIPGGYADASGFGPQGGNPPGNAFVPGFGIMPLSSQPVRNTLGFVSDKTAGVNLIAMPWPTTLYHEHYREGQIIFAKCDVTGVDDMSVHKVATQTMMVTLPQLNDVCRRLHKTIRNTPAQADASTLVGDLVLPDNTKDFMTETATDIHTVYTDVHRFAENWRMIGVVTSIANRNTEAPLLRVTVDGPVVLDNVWGKHIRPRSRVGFIIRGPPKDGSPDIPGKKTGQPKAAVHQRIEIRPWPEPTDDVSDTIDASYKDATGERGEWPTPEQLRGGVFISVGQVDYVESKKLTRDRSLAMANTGESLSTRVSNVATGQGSNSIRIILDAASPRRAPSDQRCTGMLPDGKKFPLLFA